MKRIIYCLVQLSFFLMLLQYAQAEAPLAEAPATPSATASAIPIAAAAKKPPVGLAPPVTSVPMLQGAT
jgi:hypothetical protein